MVVVVFLCAAVLAPVTVRPPSHRVCTQYVHVYLTLEYLTVTNRLDRKQILILVLHYKL